MSEKIRQKAPTQNTGARRRKKKPPEALNQEPVVATLSGSEVPVVSGDVTVTEAQLRPYDENLLEWSRTQWQFGDWESLAQISRDKLQHHPERAELALLTAAGHLQQGNTSTARQFTRLAQDWGCGKKLISQILIAGIHNSLHRASIIMGQESRALEHFHRSVAVGFSGSDARLLTQSRITQQFSQLDYPVTCQLQHTLQVLNTTGTTPLSTLRESCISHSSCSPTQIDLAFPHYCADLAILSKQCVKNKGLFIDCGGYDGCSAIKFLLLNSNYEVVSFEPNPELWKYYEGIPTTLIKKAVYVYDGKVDLYIDPVDADGSSLFKEKKIDYTGKVKNEDCPVVNVDCVDLSSYVESVSGKYEHIALKLDVEGAEYDVLEKILSDNTIKYIDRLLCEFHWEKASISRERHDRLINSLNTNLIVEEWDALEFSIHGQEQSHFKVRRAILESIRSNIQG